MKKFGFALLTTALVGTLLTAHSSAKAADFSPYGTSTLQVGVSGESVQHLQEDLRVLGYFSYPANSGYFGPLTEEAVRHFQCDHGVDVTGRVGQTTGPMIAEYALGSRAARIGAQFQGVPYVWGGTTPEGFDCSGYVQYVYNKIGITLPRTASEMYAEGAWVSKDQLRKGDLVFFSTYQSGASHVGIYVGDGQFLSATSSHGVSYTTLSNLYWAQRYIGAKRVL